MPRVPKPPLLVAVCCSALLFAGCGGGSEKAASTTTTAAATSSSETTGTTAAAETSTNLAASPDAAAGAALGHEGKVGDKLVTEGFRDQKEMMAIKVTEIIDPADAIMTAARYKTDPDKRFVIVKSEFTNLGPNPYDTTPDLNMVLVDDRDQEYRKSIAIVDACPGYPHEPLATNATASGCSFFELAKATPVVAVRWSPRSDLKDRTLTWRR